MFIEKKLSKGVVSLFAAIISLTIMFAGCKTSTSSSDDDDGDSGTVLVTEITISGATTVANGKTAKLSASVAPSNATNKTLTWSSNAESVATVSGGTVTGVGTGSATISATANDGSGVSQTWSVSVIDASTVTGDISITKSGGWFESVYAQWSPVSDTSVDGYNVFYKESSSSDYTQIDGMLVRSYASTAGGTTVDHYRADVVGLAAGTYDIKVVATVSGAETSATGTVTSLQADSYDRSGFAFTGSTMPGAYKEDGTLKDNAIVLYATKDNVSTITYTAVSGTNSSKSATYTGLQNVLSEASLKNLTVPLCIRVIGPITSNEFTSSMWGSSSEGLQVKSTGSYGVTIEGIGEDATLWGFGILCRSTNYVELRNFAVMYCADDSISLDTANLYSWVHNLDLFYGKPGSAADQVKGDGTVDVKGNSQYQTYSYNHFWDSGKCSLCGMTSEKGPNYLTYHHNWFDHSDSRHPRIRTMTVYVYNNYYDGNAKYGAGATMGADVFMDSNYFRNCKFPMLSSLQGNDIYAGTGTSDATNNATFSDETGGSIKAYNNYIAEGSTTTSYWPYGTTGTAWTKGTSGSVPSGVDTTVQFDAYEVSSRSETVPSTVVSVSGADTYSNFDTDTNIDLGVEESDIDTPANAKTKVESYAGRMNGGDFSWTFDDSTEDTNSSVIENLKTAIENYKTSLVAVLGDDSSGSGGDSGSGDDSGSGGGSGTTIEGSVVCTFTADGGSNSSFTISGSTSNSKGTCTVNSTEYTYCLKMESSTSVSFTTASTMTLTLVFGGTTSASGKTAKIDNTKYTTTASGDNYVITQSLEAGTHTITKGDSINLFYISLAE